VGINVQNLVRPGSEVSKNLEEAISLVKAKDLEGIQKRFKTEPLDLVGSLIRSVFVAPKGKKLVICDLSAVENRVLAYICDAPSILKVFQDKLDPYVYFAVDLYNEPYEVLLKDKQKRQNAKPAVLGAGYGLSGGEQITSDNGDIVFTGLMQYGRSLGVEISRELAHKSVEVFREKHHEVVSCWYALEKAATKCILTRQPQIVNIVKFSMVEDVMCITLPSGRDLHYVSPRIIDDVWPNGRKKKSIEIFGMDLVTHVWNRTRTYGAKILENIDQAISRDLLVESMFNARKMGFDIVMHSHDELVTEVEKDSKLGIDQLRSCMIQSPIWSNSNLILDAAGFESKIYRKE